MTMNGPLQELDLRAMQGDGWTRLFNVNSTNPPGPMPLDGYDAGWSLRANYGDAAPLFSMTIGHNSANGSSVYLVTPPGTSVLSSVGVTIVAAESLALPTMVGQRTTKFFYNLWVTPPGQDPITLSAGAWYLWTRV